MPTVAPSRMTGTVAKSEIVSRPGSRPVAGRPLCSTARTVARRASTESPWAFGVCSRASASPSGRKKLTSRRFSRSASGVPSAA